MSVQAPPAPPVEPTPVETPMGVSNISFEELAGIPASVPTPVVPAAPPAAPGSPEAPPASLDDIFKPTAPPEPTEPPPGEEPEDKSLPAKLRAQMAQQAKQHREEADRLRAEREEFEARTRELENEFDSFRREVSVSDPTLAPEVVAASSSLNSRVREVAKTLPPTHARKFIEGARSYIDSFAALPDITDPTYDAKHAELTTRLNKDFAGYSDEVLKQLPGLEGMANQVKAAVTNASSNSGDVLATRALKVHQDSLQAFEESAKSTLTYSAELAAAEPWSARNIVAKLIEHSDEFKQLSPQINGLLRQGLIPPAPLSQEAMAGLTPQQRSEALFNQSRNHGAASKEVFENTALAFHCMMALPKVSKLYAEALKELNALKGSSPTPKGRGQDDTPPPSAPEMPVSGVRPISLAELTKGA